MADSKPNHTAPQSEKPLTLSDRVRSLRLPQRTAQPSRGWSFVPWSLCAVLAITTGVFAYMAFSVSSPVPANETASGNNNSTPSNNSAPSSGDIVLESKGYIVPLHLIQVSPKVGGMVIELNIEEGMRVPKGFVLAKLETTEYKADFDRSAHTCEAAEQRYLELEKGHRKQEIHQAKAELEDSKAQLDQLFSDWQRTEKLKANGVLGNREYEVAYSSYKSMEERVKKLQFAYDLMKIGPREEKVLAAKAEMESARAEMTKAKWKLDNCTIFAPVSGTILSKKAEKGNMVNPSAFSNGLSASVCEMADLTEMEVDLAIPERDIKLIRKGQECQVRAEAFPKRVYEGVVSRIMPMADRAKGAIPVRVKIFIPRDEEGQYLRPEMGAFVTFLNKKSNREL